MMPAPRLRDRLPAWLRWPSRTARFRLTALYGGLFVLSGAALVAVTYGLFEQATKYTKPSLPRIPQAPTIRELERLNPPGSPLNAYINGPAGTALGNVQTQLTKVQKQLAQGLPGTYLPGQRKLVQSQHQLSAAVHQLARAVHQMAAAGTVQTAQRAADSHQLLVNAGIALGIVTVLALLAGWLLAGRMLRPIRTITKAARRISSASLHERLALEGPKDELKELGDTLDDLFGRLDAAFDSQRIFVANASHELRTPLTAERNLLQVALDDPHTSAEAWRSTARELLESNEEQNELIDALLTLASSQGGLDHREPADLSVITQTVLLDRDVERLGLGVDADLGPAPLDGDPLLLESLVANLIDNAVTHNVEGGEVGVSTGSKDGCAWLAVSNTGPVVPATDVDRLFQPFERLDPHRLHRKVGHGLGLSIVRAIAVAHGATIRAEPSPRGGLSVDVVFPPSGTAGPEAAGSYPASAGARTRFGPESEENPPGVAAFPSERGTRV